jgi:hypothetical protein
VLSIAVLAGCADLDLTSSTQQESHAWGGYHWGRTNNPFTLRIGDNVTSQWDAILDTTITDWSKSTITDLVKVTGQAKGRCRGTLGRVEVCSNTYGKNGWLGLASIWISGGTHITQGTVKLNDTYMNTPRYDTTAWRNLVSCQEVGHMLGLDHQDENFENPSLGSCMDYTSDPSANQHPNQHDYEQLQTIYAHLDATTTIGAEPTPGSEPAESPSAWGELVSSSHGGRLATYVKEHGGGARMVTFVTWAD